MNDVESLLRARDRGAFLDLCVIFARWPKGAERAAKLTAVREAMASWDDDARVAFTSSGWLFDGGGLADLAVLVRILEIYRRGDRGGADLLAVASSPYVQELVCLRVLSSDVDDHAWQALAESPHLGGLKRLEVRGVPLGDGALGALLREGRHGGLTTLELAGVGLEADALVPAVRTVPFPRLERLDLYGNILGDEGAHRLAAAPWTSPVRRLDAGRNQLTAAGVEALLGMRSLTELDARDNQIFAGEDTALIATARRRNVALQL